MAETSSGSVMLTVTASPRFSRATRSGTAARCAASAALASKARCFCPARFVVSCDPPPCSRSCPASNARSARLLPRLQLQGGLPVRGRHRHTFVNTAEDPSLRGGIDPVRQPGQLRMKIAPEFEAVEGVSDRLTEPRLATCSCRTLPSTRRVSARLTCSRPAVGRKRTNMVVAWNRAFCFRQENAPLQARGLSGAAARPLLKRTDCCTYQRLWPGFVGGTVLSAATTFRSGPTSISPSPEDLPTCRRRNRARNSDRLSSFDGALCGSIALSAPPNE